MKESDTQRFNLVFRGQLLPGTDPERAKRTLAAFFGLRDAAGVAQFFSGKPVPLRRNLTQNDAQRLYRQLRSVGLICEIPQVTPDEAATPATPQVESAAPKTGTRRQPKNSRRPRRPRRPKQSKRSKQSKQIGKTEQSKQSEQTEQTELSKQPEQPRRARQSKRSASNAKPAAKTPERLQKEVKAAPAPTAERLRTAAPRTSALPARRQKPAQAPPPAPPAPLVPSASPAPPAPSAQLAPPAPPVRRAPPAAPVPPAPPAPPAPAMRRAPSLAPAPPAPQQLEAERGTAPNLFALRPAPAPQTPGALRQGVQIRGLIAATASLSLVMLIAVVALRLPTTAPGDEPAGPLAMTSLGGNELVLLLEGALLIHERSGLPKTRVSAAELGFERLAAPLLATTTDELIFNAASGNDPARLQRCSISSKVCYPFNAEILDSQVVAISQSMLGDSFFVLGAAGQLWRNNAAGEIQVEAKVPIPWGQPRLLTRDGLLVIPDREGPLLGVYRPDRQNFGQQLDALLLMPPSAISAGQDRVYDIAASDTGRWALLVGGEAAPGLFRFDSQWGSPDGIPIDSRISRPFLQIWRDKLLLADPSQMLIQRFSSDGQTEAAFESALLAQERQDWLQATKRRTFIRKMGMFFPGLLSMFCIAAAALYLLSYRAMRAMPNETRSALLDPIPPGVRWLPGAPRRQSAIQRLGAGLTAFTVVVTLAFALLWGSLALLAGLPMLASVLYAWHSLRRGSGGHLGLVGKHVIVADYDGRYFFGKRSELRGTSMCLLAPGVALPLLLPLLPNINTHSTPGEPYAATKSRQCSNAALFGALWLMRHPWMDALIAFGGGSLISGFGWLLLAS